MDCSPVCLGVKSVAANSLPPAANVAKAECEARQRAERLVADLRRDGYLFDDDHLPNLSPIRPSASTGGGGGGSGGSGGGGGGGGESSGGQGAGGASLLGTGTPTSGLETYLSPSLDTQPLRSKHSTKNTPSFATAVRRLVFGGDCQHGRATGRVSARSAVAIPVSTWPVQACARVSVLTDRFIHYLEICYQNLLAFIFPQALFSHKQEVGSFAGTQSLVGIRWT